MSCRMTKTKQANTQMQTPGERLRQKHATSAYNSAPTWSLESMSFVAEKATQEGVQLPEASRVPARSAMDMGKNWLPRLALKKEGLLSTGDLAKEVTEAEIRDHIAQNPGYYKHLIKSAPDRAALSARTRIAGEKLKQKRADFMKDLRAYAAIEIVDERFM